MLVNTNQVNRERYQAVILPGGAVLSVSALEKLKAYWDAGGTIIATSLLPSRSAEFGRDDDVRRLVSEMFGKATGENGEPAIHRNGAGGQAIFLARPSSESLATTLNRLNLKPDVAFPGLSSPTSGNGLFGYIHRVRDGKDIYYFGNSSDTPIDATVELRGRLRRPESWNPHSGHVTPVRDVEYRDTESGALTVLRMSIPPVSSLAIVGVQR
jgi:hypothetical protein